MQPLWNNVSANIKNCGFEKNAFKVSQASKSLKFLFNFNQRCLHHRFVHRDVFFWYQSIVQAKKNNSDFLKILDPLLRTMRKSQHYNRKRCVKTYFTHVMKNISILPHCEAAIWPFYWSEFERKKNITDWISYNVTHLDLWSKTSTGSVSNSQESSLISLNHTVKRRKGKRREWHRVFFKVKPVLTSGSGLSSEARARVERGFAGLLTPP